MYIDSRIYFGGEPIIGGELVPVDDELRPELRRGRSASSIDIERERRPNPTKPASIGKPDTMQKKMRLFISERMK